MIDQPFMLGIVNDDGKGFSLELVFHKERSNKRLKLLLVKVLRRKVFNQNTIRIILAKLWNFEVRLHFTHVVLNIFIAFPSKEDILT